MGKFITFLSILIFIDLVFLVTGQTTLNSPSSIIINALIDPANIKTSQFFLVLFGVAGIAGLAALSGVSTGIINNSGVSILGFATTAAALILLVGDYIAVYSYLRSLNAVFAILVMSPIILIFVMTVAEWLRGKD